MEAQKRKSVVVPVILAAALVYAFITKLIPYYYEEVIAGWKTGCLTVAFVLLMTAIYLLFVKNKRVLAAIMAVAAVAYGIVYVATLPKYTRPQAVEMLYEEVPELEGYQLMENTIKQLITVDQYIISFSQEETWRHFIVDPDTLEFFEEDNVLLWYGQTH